MSADASCILQYTGRCGSTGPAGRAWFKFSDSVQTCISKRANSTAMGPTTNDGCSTAQFAGVVCIKVGYDVLKGISNVTSVTNDVSWVNTTDSSSCATPGYKNLTYRRAVDFLLAAQAAPTPLAAVPDCPRGYRVSMTHEFGSTVTNSFVSGTSSLGGSAGAVITYCGSGCRTSCAFNGAGTQNVFLVRDSQFTCAYKRAGTPRVVACTRHANIFWIADQNEWDGLAYDCAVVNGTASALLFGHAGYVCVLDRDLNFDNLEIPNFVLSRGSESDGGYNTLFDGRIDFNGDGHLFPGGSSFVRRAALRRWVARRLLSRLQHRVPTTSCLASRQLSHRPARVST
jgi:hypothetical protein